MEIILTKIFGIFLAVFLLLLIVYIIADTLYYNVPFNEESKFNKFYNFVGEIAWQTTYYIEKIFKFIAIFALSVVITLLVLTLIGTIITLIFL